MTDPVFAPTTKPADSVAPGNAELVYLGETLFVIKGVFFHPVTQADAPLPPHRWALVNEVKQLFLEGPTSDSAGLSTIMKTDLKGDAADEWTLWLIPIFSDKGDTSEVAKLGEVWIDVDKNEWVRTSSLSDKPWIEARRLLRFPRWTSARKAAFGGGFRDALPGAPDFATTGNVKKSELAPHGTRDAPWTIAIDHGWMRTYVQLRVYDAGKKKDAAVPQGIVLEALATNAVAGVEHARMGASSVRLDDGSIYVIHARDAAQATDLDYQWRTPANATFTYDKGTFASAERHMVDMARAEKEYSLPIVWHSLGTEAWEGPADPTSSSRKPFSAIRTKGTSKSAPLCFHLDDVVLTKYLKPITLDPAAKRIAIYTTIGELRDPKKSGSDPLPYSTLEVTKFPLRADDVAFQRGRGFEWQTLFFDHEGELYELGNSWVMGTPGTDPHVGSRAAGEPFELQDYAYSSGRDDITSGHRVYLFDARWVKIPYQGASMRLAHLVCYVSVFLDGAQLNAKNNDALDVVDVALYDSMTRWDQKHPGINDSSLKKNYVIVPESGIKDDATMVKIRHVFGSRSLPKGTPKTATNPARPQPIVIQIDSQPGRPTGGDPMRLYCLRGDNMEPPPDPDWLKATAAVGGRPYPFEPNSKLTYADSFDKTVFRHSSIGHELGHESGFLDEYLEGIKISAKEPLATEFVPMFHQFGIRARPYYLDVGAMMKHDYLPRLRYTWNYVDALHERSSTMLADHWSRKERPFIAQYVAGSKTLRHAIPRKAPDYKTAHGGPWTQTIGKHNLCDLSFYPTSEDEGTIGPMFLESGTLSKPFDGLLVVHPMIWVRYGPKVKGLLLQWTLFAKWATRYFDVKTTAKFAIETAGVELAKRVAIIFQPRFELDTLPSAKANKSLTTLELLIHENGGQPSVTAGSPPVLSMDSKHVGNWILRYAINQPTKLSPNDDPTKASDLTSLTTALATLLKRTEKGTVVSYG